MFNLANLSKYKFSPLHNADGSPCYFRVTCLTIFALSLIVHVVTKPHGEGDNATSLVAEVQNINPQEILANTIVNKDDVAAVASSVNINTASYQNDVGQSARTGAVMIGQRGEISLNPLKTVANETVSMQGSKSLELNTSKINMPTSGTISIPTAKVTNRAVHSSALQSSTAVQPPSNSMGEELVASNVASSGLTASSGTNAVPAVANPAQPGNSETVASAESNGNSFWSFFGNDESKNHAAKDTTVPAQIVDTKALAVNRTMALSEMVNGFSLLVSCGKIRGSYENCSFSFSKKVKKNFDTKVISNAKAFAIALAAKGDQLADDCVKYEFSSTGVYRAYDKQGQLSDSCLMDPAINKQIAAINDAVRKLDKNVHKDELLVSDI